VNSNMEEKVRRGSGPNLSRIRRFE